MQSVRSLFAVKPGSELAKQRFQLLDRIVKDLQRVLDRLLQSWQSREYAALYSMLTDGRETLPRWEAFEAKMHELDVSLLEYETTAGSVSFDGKRATLVLSARIRTPDGGDTVLTREAIPLRRERGSWVMNYDTLLSLMIRD